LIDLQDFLDFDQLQWLDLGFWNLGLAKHTLPRQLFELLQKAHQ